MCLASRVSRKQTGTDKKGLAPSGMVLSGTAGLGVTSPLRKLIQAVEGEGSWFLPQNRRVLPQVLIVLEHVKIFSMGYAFVVCQV